MSVGSLWVFVFIIQHYTEKGCGSSGILHFSEKTVLPHFGLWFIWGRGEGWYVNPLKLRLDMKICPINFVFINLPYWLSRLKCFA